MENKFIKNINSKILYFLLSIILLNSGFNLRSTDTSVDAEIFQPSGPEDFENVFDIDSEEETEISYLQQEPVLVNGQEAKIGLTMNFPVIGDVVLYEEKDGGGKGILKATLDKKSINLDTLGITIDNLTIAVIDNKSPQVSADVTVFGKKASLELIELKKASKIIKEPVVGTKYNKLDLPIGLAHFRIKFIDKPSIEILPLKSIDLNYLDFIIEKDKPAKLITDINILGTIVQVSFASNKDKKLSFELLVPKITLGNFFSELKDSQFNNTALKDLLLKVSFEPKDTDKAKQVENKFVYSFSGWADFSSIKLLGIENISLDKLNITGSYSKINGLDIESDLVNFKIPGFSAVETGKFIFYSKRAIKAKIELVKERLAKNKELTLESLEKHELKLLTLIGKEDNPLILIHGSGNIDLPKIGKLDFKLSADYSSIGLEIRGYFGQPVNYGNFKIDNAEFELNTNTKSILITGVAQLQGFDLNAKLQVSQDPKDPNNKIYKAEASTAKKNWQPFANFNLPDFLKELDIKNLSAAVNVSYGANKNIEAKLILNGDVDVMKTSLKSQIMAIKSGGKSGILLKAEASSNQLPAGLNKLPIEKVYFVATNIEYKDLENRITYEPNTLTLVGKINLTGILDPIGKIIGNKEAAFNIIGHVNPNKIENSKLSVQLSQGIPVKTKVISIGPVSIDIGIKNATPVIALNTHLILRPNSDDVDKELDFSGIASVSPTEIAGELRLDGMWQNPFGLKGVEVGDLDVALGINPQTFFETFTPSKFNLGGRLQLAPDKIITLAIAINYIANQVAFLGSLESNDISKPGNMSLQDIVTFIANRLDAKIPEDKIPVIEIQEPKFSFASRDTQVGAINIPMGIMVNGKLTLLSQIFDITFGISTSGIIAKGAMTPVILGPLKLTAGKMVSGGIRKTKYGGPEVDIELTLSRQIFLISCLLELDSVISGSGDMEVSKNGINFNFEVLVGPDKVFSAIMQGQSSGSISDPGFDFMILMKQQFIAFAQEEIYKALKNAEEKLKKGIEKAVIEIKKIDSAIEKHKKDLENAKKEVENKKKDLDVLDTALKKATSEIDKWKAKISELQNDINKADSEINKLKKKNVKLWDVKGKIEKEAKIKFFQAQKLTFQASIKAANATLEKLLKNSATITLKTSKSAAEKAFNTAKSFLNKIQAIDVKILEISRNKSIDVLKLADDTGIGVLKGTDFATKSILTGFNIKEFKLESSLDKIKSGELFDVSIDMQLLGKDRNFKTKFNLKDIKNNINKISHEIIAKFIPKI